jgi:hypothetical protein
MPVWNSKEALHDFEACREIPQLRNNLRHFPDMLHHDKYDDWQNSAVPLEEDSVFVESFGSMANTPCVGFTRTEEPLVDGVAPEHGAFDDFTKQDFYNRRSRLIRHYMANRQRNN